MNLATVNGMSPSTLTLTPAMSPLCPPTPCRHEFGGRDNVGHARCRGRGGHPPAVDEAVGLVPFVGHRSALRHIETDFVERTPEEWRRITDAPL